MIKTLKISSGVIAKLGSVELQTVPSATPTTVATLTPTLVVKPSEAIIPSATAIEGASSSTKKSLSISKMAEGLSIKPDFKVPSVIAEGLNHVMPSFSSDIKPRTLIPSSSDEMTMTTRKFEPYELMTGISHERPEIILLTNFQPLFDNTNNSSAQTKGDGYDGSKRYMRFMADAGTFFDAQMHIRNLRQVNVNHLLATLKGKYPNLANEYDERSHTFTYAMRELHSTASYMWTLVNVMDKMKDQLDLRNASYKADSQRVLKSHVDAFTLARSRALLEHLNSAGNSSLPDSFDIIDLMSYYGYLGSNAKSIFSSTKLWLQLSLEMKEVLRTHSLQFIDIEPVMQRQDTNPSNITKTPGIKRFEYSNYVPNVPTLIELIKKKVPEVSKAINDLTTTYGVMYENVHLKNDQIKIAALSNTITREFRYSRGLANADVQKTLRNSYGYNVNPTGANQQFIDSIVGQFGNNISDFPALTLNNSVALTDIAQRRVSDNIAVLTFESKYVDGDTGTLTPGSSYYVDSVFNASDKAYDTSRLKELSTVLKSAHTAFSTIVNGMNFFASEFVDETDPASSGWDMSLTNPRALFKKVLELFVSEQSSPLPDLRDDMLASVFSAAASNVKLRSALFMHVMMSLSRAYTIDVPYFDSDGIGDNTPSTDYLVDQIMNMLASSPSTITSAKMTSTMKFLIGTIPASDVVTTTQVTATALKEALRGGFSRCYMLIMNVMRRILSSFKYKGLALVNNHTMYGGHLDTIVMMSVFDMVVSVLKSFGGQSISGQQNDKGILTYTISHNVEKHTDSINDIIRRVETDASLAQQSIIFFLNAFDKTSNAALNVINYLESDSSTSELTKVSTVLGSQKLLKMLMNKQQIMLFASSVAEVLERMSSNKHVYPAGDVDGSGDFDTDDQIKCLDDSAIDVRLRDVALAFFNDPEYCSGKAFNKRVLTVGIPLGFTQRLKQKVDIKSSKKNTFADKESDIVNVAVYKVDARNADIIYKPIKFPFELSRFPVRNTTLFKKVDENVQPTSLVPTRNMDEVSSTGRAVQYFPAVLGETYAFATKEYDFLDQRTKEAIHKNHVTSYMLEVYLKVLMGISTNDSSFNIADTLSNVEPQFMKLLVDHSIDWLTSTKTTQQAQASSTSTHSGGTFFSATAPSPIRVSTTKLTAAFGSKSTKTSTGAESKIVDTLPKTVSLAETTAPIDLAASLSRLSSKDVSTAMHMLSTISDFSMIQTPLSNAASVIKKLLQPKQFDRVFNIVVDPDDFEVDVEATSKTSQGAAVLHQMIERHEIIERKEQSSLGPTSTSSTQTYVMREKSKSEGDITFEKYIVTIETLDESGVF